MPVWMAVAAVAAIYVLRSALRGWDFRPDLPLDAILLGIFVALIAARLLMGRRGPDRGEDERGAQGPRVDDGTRGPGATP
jgi:hypothetical protein